MTLRLHGTCPECGASETLRPDGTVTQHMRPRRGYEYRSHRCEGTGLAPIAGSVAAWLDAQDADARAAVERAERAVTYALAARERAEAHAAETTEWTAKQRAKLAKAGT